MPTTQQSPAAKPKPARAGKPKPSRAAKARSSSALDGLEVSLDDAQKAITELRRDLSTGGRRLVKDVDAAVKSARRDLRRTRKAIQSDLGDLGGALTPRRATKAPAKKPAAKATRTTGSARSAKA